MPAPRTSLHGHRVPLSAWTRLLLSKVPEVTLPFWVLTVLLTILGESATEFLAGDLGLQVPATTAVMGLLLSIALIAQFSLRRHLPAAYWLSVGLVSSVGALLTDNLVDDLGADPWTTTAVFAAAFAATLAAWYACEHTLSIHMVVTRRREAFYWLAVLFAFALGTSLGEVLSLAPAPSAMLWCGAVALIALGHQRGLNGVAAYWAAYVVTWPLGAALADLVGGPITSGLVVVAIILGLGWSTVTGRAHTRVRPGRF